MFKIAHNGDMSVIELGVSIAIWTIEVLKASRARADYGASPLD
jgi:hypothetical protein